MGFYRYKDLALHSSVTICATPVADGVEGESPKYPVVKVIYDMCREAMMRKDDTSENLKERLTEIVCLEPSVANSQPWRFIFVTDETLKNELAKASYLNEQKIKDCSILVVLSSTSSVQRFEEWMYETLHSGAIAYYNEFIRQQEQQQVLAWFDRQVYLSLGILLGACTMMGLDSLPMQGIEAIKYDAILNLDTHHCVCAVAVGFRANPASSKDMETL